MPFPTTRLRRLRENMILRTMVSETHLDPSDLIMPLFVDERATKPVEIPSMPGQFRYPISECLEACAKIYSKGIKAVLLFGIPKHKDDKGSGAFSEEGIIQQMLRRLKTELPELLCITDLCLCEYTSHGHCGMVSAGRIVNDPTLEILANTAVSQAQAGADVIAPSDMMDGRIQAIRTSLDQHGFGHIPIISYAAKYASGFYGPFREAAESTPQFGDRRSYQMNPSNSREAMREIEMDIEEGADIVMVKPALAYLDILQKARQTFNVPIAAYNVSGEYSMVKAAAQNHWIDEKRIILEILTSIKRAGADMIFTYHADEIVDLL